jgi:hypothetical protein
VPLLIRSIEIQPIRKQGTELQETFEWFGSAIAELETDPMTGAVIANIQNFAAIWPEPIRAGASLFQRQGALRVFQMLDVGAKSEGFTGLGQSYRLCGSETRKCHTHEDQERDPGPEVPGKSLVEGWSPRDGKVQLKPAV